MNLFHCCSHYSLPSILPAKLLLPYHNSQQSQCAESGPVNGHGFLPLRHAVAVHALWATDLCQEHCHVAWRGAAVPCHPLYSPQLLTIMISPTAAHIMVYVLKAMHRNINQRQKFVRGMSSFSAGILLTLMLTDDCNGRPPKCLCLAHLAVIHTDDRTATVNICVEQT